MRSDQPIGRQTGQHFLTGHDEGSQVTAIILFIPESIIIV
jgi:hypothetical protein